MNHLNEHESAKHPMNKHMTDTKEYQSSLSYKISNKHLSSNIIQNQIHILQALPSYSKNTYTQTPHYKHTPPPKKKKKNVFKHDPRPPPPKKNTHTHSTFAPPPPSIVRPRHGKRPPGKRKSCALAATEIKASDRSERRSLEGLFDQTDLGKKGSSGDGRLRFFFVFFLRGFMFWKRIFVGKKVPIDL